jgi:hypothetical protein
MRKIKKRGDLLFPPLIFLVLNIAFFVILMAFVQKASTGAVVYEEAYAKKIGLLLNNVESGMKFIIDVTELEKIARKNDLKEDDLEKIIKEMVQIDTQNGTITVKTRNEGGFVYPFFSKVELESQIVEDSTGNKLIINIK